MPVSPSFPAVDSFNRANEGPPMTGWTDILGGWKVLSNQAAPNIANTISFYNVTSPGADCEGFVAMPVKPTDGNTLSIFVRGKDTGSVLTFDGYALQVAAAAGTDSINIVRVDNAVGTTLTSFSQETANGDGTLLTIVGSTLVASYFNGTSWVILGSATDSTYPNAGVCGMIANDTTVRADNFGFGTVRMADLITSNDFLIPVRR